MRAVKSDEIKVRIEPIKKLALQQVAEREGLELSDVARRAFNELLQRYANEELKKAA